MGSKGDCCLLTVTLIFIILDIVLAICLRFVLPYHLTKDGWYAADDSKQSFEDATKICPCLLKVFPEGSKEKIQFSKIPEKAMDKRSAPNFTEVLIMDHPYLVSLSKNTTEGVRFLCNGLAQSGEWLLTVDTCVEDDLEWYNLLVRSETPFWNNLGQIHYILDTVKGNFGLVYLRVLPPFSKNVALSAPKLQPYFMPWASAVVVGWDQETNTTFENDLFKIEDWSSIMFDTESSKICGGYPNCGKLTSQFLISGCNEIIGAKLTGEGCNWFASFGGKLPTGFCYQIYRKPLTANLTETCFK